MESPASNPRVAALETIVASIVAAMRDEDRARVKAALRNQAEIAKTAFLNGPKTSDTFIDEYDLQLGRLAYAMGIVD